MIRSLLLIFFVALVTVGCKNKQTVTGSKVKKSDNIESEIIVQLQADVSMRRLIAVFEEYELEEINSINKEMNIWLVTYNMEKITPDEMLQKLQSNSSVVSAEFNKKVTLR